MTTPTLIINWRETMEEFEDAFADELEVLRECEGIFSGPQYVTFASTSNSRKQLQ